MKNTTSISYNKIIPKKKSDDTKTTLNANNNDKSPPPEYNFQTILKNKHLIFKSKVDKPPEKKKTLTKVESPPKQSTLRAKRSFSEKNNSDPADLENNINSNLTNLQKRFKLKAKHENWKTT